ncbi:MAG: glutathione S-transferase family protein [Betaproteobacteria bacterium]|nr:glutathione S-transferase family protein [Betaproteobacteria bacterium]
MLKIYGQARSRAFRVLWLAKEINLPYEHIPVSIHVEGAQAKEDWYKQLNPNARIPTIDDDGIILWESAAINVYLARKHGGMLYPKTAEGEGRMLQWGFYIANDVEPPMIAVFQHRVAFPPEKRIPAIADEGEKNLQPGLQTIEGQLEKTPFLQGNEWGMADFLAASVLYTLYMIKYDLSKFPRLGAWLSASCERPAAREARKLRE